MSMTLIEHIEVTAASVASVEFDLIPDTYTDLMLVASIRSTYAVTTSNVLLSLNGTGSVTRRALLGSGSSASSTTSGGGSGYSGVVSGANSTSNTFGNMTYYFPNYAGSNQKSISTDSVSENNATEAYQAIHALLWSESSVIDTITLTDMSANIGQYSSFTLYGITAGSDGTTTVS